MSETTIMIIQLSTAKKIVSEILADLALARELKSSGWIGELVSELHLYQSEVERLTKALSN